MADLAGTTTRTVRYYHRLGLLPEEPAQGRSAIEADLLATRAQIDARIEVLHHQRTRIDELVARVRSGEALSPLPIVLERFYDHLEGLVEDPATLPVIRTDQRMVLALAISGLIPASLGPFIEGLSDEDHRALVRMFTAFAKLDRSRYPSAYGDEERERIIEDFEEAEWAVLERNRSTALAMLRDLPSGGPGHLLWKRVAQLSKIGYPEPDQRQVIDDLFRRLQADPEFGPVLEEKTGKDWNIV